jgi:hypothetical protein
MQGVITNKAGRIVQFESFAERTLLLRFDRDPGVRDYGSQPETFAYVDTAGHAHRYTPDFLVWRADGEVQIHEVTRSERRTWPNQRQREAAAQQICQARGWRYLVHTEASLPQGHELVNLLALWKYRPLACRHRQVDAALAQRPPQGPVSLAGLVTQIAQEQRLPSAHVVSALGHLLWHGELMTDWQTALFGDAALTPEALVWLAPKKEG